jgi:hypothetical protein
VCARASHCLARIAANQEWVLRKERDERAPTVVVVSTRLKTRATRPLSSVALAEKTDYLKGFVRDGICSVDEMARGGISPPLCAHEFFGWPGARSKEEHTCQVRQVLRNTPFTQCW